MSQRVKNILEALMMAHKRIVEMKAIDGRNGYSMASAESKMAWQKAFDSATREIVRLERDLDETIKDVYKKAK